MSNLSTFTFQSEKSVRIELFKNEPFFCLKDVAEILELKDTKSKNFNLQAGGVETFPLIDKLGRKQEATFINEPNLYRVIFRSNKAEAVKFQNWIFEEVLPQIRKTGSYSVGFVPSLPNLTGCPDAKEQYLRLSKQALLQFGAVLFLYKISEFGIFGLQRLKPLYAMQVPLKIG